MLTSYIDNFSHPGFITPGIITRQSSILKSTGGLVSIMGGLGFEAKGDKIGSNN